LRSSIEGHAASPDENALVDSGISRDATHLRWFTSSSIRSLTASAGFEVTAYRASAGIAVPDNLNHAPLRWLPSDYRTPLLRIGSRRWPTLFGAQHVVKAEMQ
jgi:hypothetical protein